MLDRSVFSVGSRAVLGRSLHRFTVGELARTCQATRICTYKQNKKRTAFALETPGISNSSTQRAQHTDTTTAHENLEVLQPSEAETTHKACRHVTRGIVSSRMSPVHEFQGSFPPVMSEGLGAMAVSNVGAYSCASTPRARPSTTTRTSPDPPFTSEATASCCYNFSSSSPLAG